MNRTNKVVVSMVIAKSGYKISINGQGKTSMGVANRIAAKDTEG